MSTAQWANIGDDAGALHALVERIRTHVAIEAVDYLWLFPPRRIAIGESIVVVVAAFDEDPERRRVITARFTVSRNRKGVADVKEKVDEHGAAPADAVPRIVQGVLRRLGEDAEAEPRAEQISGEAERWDALIVDLGGKPIVRDEDPAEVVDSSGAALDTEHAEPMADDGVADAGPVAEADSESDAQPAAAPDEENPSDDEAAAVDLERPDSQS